MEAYVITNGIYYISQRNNVYSPVTRPDLASAWDDEEKVRRIAATTLPKVLRGRGYHVEKMECTPDQIVLTGKRKKVTSTIATGITPKSVPEVSAMVKQIDAAALTFSKLGDMMLLCEAGQAKEDAVQQDLLHKIEFESCGKGNGARLCSQLQKCRLRRRAYKDMHTFLQQISIMPTSAITPDMLESKRKELLSRVYTPRSKEVFGN